MFSHFEDTDNPMIVEGTSPLLYIDLGKDEPGMTLQHREHDKWVDVLKNGKAVKSPVDIDALPAGRYQLRPCQ